MPCCSELASAFACPVQGPLQAGDRRKHAACTLSLASCVPALTCELDPCNLVPELASVFSSGLIES
eukprot:4367590-Alexandrium_andersonii.AAC.1